MIPRMRGRATALMKLCNIPQLTFNGKHQPCPYCGGKDRFRWTDKINEKGDGGNICNQCGNDSGSDYSAYVVKITVKRLTRESGTRFRSTKRRLLVQVTTSALKLHNHASTSSEQKPSQRRFSASLRRSILSTVTHIKLARNADGAHEHIHAIPCHLVHSDELDEECNILFVNEEGKSSFLAKDYTRGSVTVTGNTGKTIYLCTDWIDAQHIHRRRDKRYGIALRRLTLKLRIATKEIANALYAALMIRKLLQQMSDNLTL
ncbi:putative DNA primase [Salmonella virus STSR3]|nr:putative DNA primase [Salmonella virus STSR3]